MTVVVVTQHRVAMRSLSFILCIYYNITLCNTNDKKNKTTGTPLLSGLRFLLLLLRLTAHFLMDSSPGHLCSSKYIVGGYVQSVLLRIVYKGRRKNQKHDDDHVFLYYYYEGNESSLSLTFILSATLSLSLLQILERKSVLLQLASPIMMVLCS